MFPENRSLSDVVQDILRNLQDIIRSEARLARKEIAEEAEKAKSAALMIAAGAVTGHFAILFLLFTLFLALALVMPNWAAALIVGTALATVAALVLRAGLQRFKQIQPVPERTVETFKENVEWAKQQAK